MRKLITIFVAAAACLGWSADGSASRAISPAERVRLEAPGAPPPAVGSERLHDAVLSVRQSARVARRLGSGELWGGTYTATNGRKALILFSDTYAVDHAQAQARAEWLATYLYYGAELERATFVVGTPDEVEYTCGEGAGGCYSPPLQTLVLPGENLPDAHMMTVWSHEYGHHVAANRSNPPWDAGSWGTKRWATHTRVCERVAAGTAFPDDSSDDNYWRNPGEVFAESYALLVNRGGAWPDNSWPAWGWRWDPSFAPTPTSLELIRQDTLDPWTAPTAERWTGTLRRKVTWVRNKKTKKRVRKLGAVLPQRVTVPTPNDGTAAFTIAGPPGTSLSVQSGDTQLVGASGAVTVPVCGRRTLDLTLTGSRPGAFAVSISKP